MYETIRYVWARAKTFERANELLEDSFACGEVSEGEAPRIEAKRDHRGKVTHYEITLNG